MLHHLAGLTVDDAAALWFLQEGVTAGGLLLLEIVTSLHRGLVRSYALRRPGRLDRKSFPGRDVTM
jgi:hypothetical protein